MNTQPTYTPSPWRARWYRFLRLLRDLYRRRNFNQELKEQRWQGIQIGRAQYLGHCPYHEKELLQEMRRGHFSCFKCESEVYARYFWMPEIREPRTDPHILPAKRYIDMRGQGAGSQTAALATVPKWLVRLREKPKGG